MSEPIDTAAFLADPYTLFGNSLTRLMAIPRPQLYDLQLKGLQQRFAELRDNVPMLKRLADNEALHAINTVDDVLPLLFDHATYKSYPSTLLDQHRFVQLTAWLNKLTTMDLSRIDVSACNSIDEWMMMLNRETPLSLIHTSGTSGTLSFLPWSKREWEKFISQYPIWFLQEFGKMDTIQLPPLNMHCIYPFYRFGGLSHCAANEMLVKLVAGTEERFHVAYPGRLSSDLLLLAARRRAAEAKGDLAKLTISPALAARRAEFEAQQRDMPRHLEAFFTQICDELAGQRIFVQATSNLLVTMAEAGLKAGRQGVFAPDTVVVTGGGGKGMVLPENWEETVKAFFGVKQLFLNFGMAEMSGVYSRCAHGHYHAPPWNIPFILDVDTNRPLPRSGTATGRFAFFDLLPETRWGGFITGDHVTMEWDKPCPCGRTTPYLTGPIQRVSAMRETGAEEKISCAATPGAYEEALDFLNELPV